MHLVSCFQFELIICFLSARSFGVKVDPRGLPHGAHFAEVDFNISFSVVDPEGMNE